MLVIKIDNGRCDECGTCVSVCPVNALLLEKTLRVDQKTCISCGACVKACPFRALDLEKQPTQQR
jgi:ferredoxin